MYLCLKPSGTDPISTCLECQWTGGFMDKKPVRSLSGHTRLTKIILRVWMMLRILYLTPLRDRMKVGRVLTMLQLHDWSWKLWVYPGVCQSWAIKIRKWVIWVYRQKIIRTSTFWSHLYGNGNSSIGRLWWWDRILQQFRDQDQRGSALVSMMNRNMSTWGINSHRKSFSCQWDPESLSKTLNSHRCHVVTILHLELYQMWNLLTRTRD